MNNSMNNTDPGLFGTLAHLGYNFTATRTYCGLKVKHLHNDPSQAVVHRDAEKSNEGLVVWCERCVAAKPIVELGAMDI